MNECNEHDEILFCPGCQSEPSKQTCNYCGEDKRVVGLCTDCEYGYENDTPPTPRRAEDFVCQKYKYLCQKSQPPAV